jgi:hypothetical protein
LGVGAFPGVAISFSGAAAVAAFAVYQYRRDACFTVKDGWLSRAEHPTALWWGILSMVLVAAMFAAPGSFASPEF